MLRIVGLTGLACLVLSVATIPVSAQQIDRELSVIGGIFRLEQPVAMTSSPTGERIAISDASANKIHVIDLSGRLIWTAGEQVNLDQPGAVCFESENSLLYVPRSATTVFRLYEERPQVMDTVCQLPASLTLKGWTGIDQISRTEGGQYFLLSEKTGQVAAFTGDWKFDRVVIDHGSGRGKLLAPSSLSITSARKIIVTDRKNYPVQIFDPDGRFLIYGGWNLPSKQRGWEAVTAAVDTRDFIWVADETDAEFRIFDQSGTQLSSLPFSSQAMRPVAMLGTIDNRMAVLHETGTLLFYTLE